MLPSYNRNCTILYRSSFVLVSLPDEMWRSHPICLEYRGSNLGRVWVEPMIAQQWNGWAIINRRFPGKLIKFSTNGLGYYIFTPRGRGQTYVGAFILECFVGLREDGQAPCYRNQDRKDNRIANLYWGVPQRRDGSLPGEVWKAHPNLPFEASSFGRVRSVSRVVKRLDPYGKESYMAVSGRVLKPSEVADGYLGYHFRQQIAAFILECFVSLRPDGMEACHNNGIPSDNRPDNLRWDTHTNNSLDRVLHGTTKPVGGWPKLTQQLQLQILEERARGKSILRISKQAGISWNRVAAVIKNAESTD